MSWLRDLSERYARHTETTLLDEADRAHQRERLPRRVSTTVAADLIDRATDDMCETESAFDDRPTGLGTVVVFLGGAVMAVLILLAIGVL